LPLGIPHLWLPRVAQVFIKTMPYDRRSLWTALNTSERVSGRFLSALDGDFAITDLIHGTCLFGRAEELRGRSVLVAAADQITTALALIELDGIASRLVLCPPDLDKEHFRFIIDSVPVDVIVSDRSDLPDTDVIRCGLPILPAAYDRNPRHRTEWILLTSGTTARPKMVVHTLSGLAGAIGATDPLADGFVWSTFYDMRRYGGLQVFLRAILTGGSLVLSSAHESVDDFLIRAGVHGVSHISGTPSHWRKAVMSPSVHRISPRYIRLSGEIADQAILDTLRSFHPQASIAHAFASTEAGVAFDVRDGLAGFPASLIAERTGDLEMKVVEASLRIRSPRIALRYIGDGAGSLTDAEGFVDTGDIVELRGDRYYFIGRRDGVINVGGLKVHPEEVESVINRHPEVRMSLVRTRKNPITGSLVVADVVLKVPADKGLARRCEREILQLCTEALPRHKVPAAISFLSELSVTGTGKLVRRRA